MSAGATSRRRMIALKVHVGRLLDAAAAAKDRPFPVRGDVRMGAGDEGDLKFMARLAVPDRSSAEVFHSARVLRGHAAQSARSSNVYASSADAATCRRFADVVCTLPRYAQLHNNALVRLDMVSPVIIGPSGRRSRRRHEHFDDRLAPVEDKTHQHGLKRRRRARAQGHGRWLGRYSGSHEHDRRRRLGRGAPRRSTRGTCLYSLAVSRGRRLVYH